MIEVLRIFADSVPLMFIAVAAIIMLGVVVMVLRCSRDNERVAELRLKRAIELERFKRGALTYTEEHGGE